MSIRKYILQDWNANRPNPTKGKYIVVLFRIAQLITRNKFSKVVFFWYLLLYRIFVEWFMCVELNWKTKIGPNFQLWHGAGTVIHPDSVIGSNCSIRQCTTIGVKQGPDGKYNDNAPVIGDNVDIGCNTVIIGSLTIGDNVSIGSGSVVVKDIPRNCVSVGNPARIIRQKELTI